MVRASPSLHQATRASRSPTLKRHATTGSRRVSSPSSSGLDPARAWITRSLHPLPAKSSIARVHLFPAKSLHAPLLSPLRHLRHGPTTSRHTSASRRPPCMAATGRRPPWPHPRAPARRLPALHPSHREEKQLRCNAINMAVRGGRR
jgi:hypothetical protein